MFYVVNKKTSDVLGQYSGNYYASAQLLGMKSQDELIEHMAAHNSTYSVGTITGVLKDMAKCIKELMLEGYSVKLDDLAIFSAAIVNKTGGLSTLEGFKVSALVEGIKMLAQATGDLSKAKLNTDYTLTHWPTAKDALAGTTTTDDGGTSTDGGSTDSGSTDSGSTEGDV